MRKLKKTNQKFIDFFKEIVLEEDLKKRLIENWGKEDVSSSVVEKLKKLLPLSSVEIVVSKYEGKFVWGSIQIFSKTQKYQFRALIEKENLNNPPVLYELFVSGLNYESEDQNTSLNQFLDSEPDMDRAKSAYQESKKDASLERKITLNIG